MRATGVSCLGSERHSGVLSRNSDQYRLIARKENKMKESTKNELKGKAQEVKGAVKETAGKVIGNPELEAEGHHERVAGKIQKKVGEVEKVREVSTQPERLLRTE
jgi:uncharacterized protein YjbJ (UPF0337 family)